MKSSYLKLNNIYLHPGEVYFTNSPEVIQTILGSCLTITMYDRESKFCGISHSLLPWCKNSTGHCNNCIEAFKYVNCCILFMLRKFESMNISRHQIEVKMFGGADVLENTMLQDSGSIGEKNISTALQILQSQKLSLSASDVGGKYGRKIFFVTADGSVYLKRLNRNEKDKNVNC